MTVGEAPASLKTETVRRTSGVSELVSAATVCGAKLRITSERASVAFRIERLPGKTGAKMRRNGRCLKAFAVTAGTNLGDELSSSVR